MGRDRGYGKRLQTTTHSRNKQVGTLVGVPGGVAIGSTASAPSGPPPSSGPTHARAPVTVLSPAPAIKPRRYYPRGGTFAGFGGGFGGGIRLVGAPSGSAGTVAATPVTTTSPKATLAASAPASGLAHDSTADLVLRPLICPVCGGVTLAPRQESALRCDCGAELFGATQHYAAPHPDAEPAVAAAGRGDLVDGDLDGVGGEVVYMPAGERPRTFTLLRSEAGGEVAIVSWGERAIVRADGACTCGAPDCVHRKVLAQLDDTWDPFAARQHTRNRGLFLSEADWQAAFDACTQVPIGAQPAYLVNDPADVIKARLVALHADPSREPACYYPYELTRRSADLLRERGAPDARRELAGLGHTLAEALCANDASRAAATLAVWHEYLRRNGVADPNLPTEVGVCGQCGKLTTASGVCPHCLVQQFSPGAKSDPAKTPYLEHALDPQSPLRAEPDLWSAAAQVAATVDRDDPRAWHAAARVWNYLLAPSHDPQAHLPDLPLTCERCHHTLPSSGVCPRCPAQFQPAVEVVEGRRWLHRAQVVGLHPDDLKGAEFLGDMAGISGIELSFGRGTVQMDYDRAAGRWQVADPASLDGLLDLVEYSPRDRERLADELAALAAWTGESTAATAAA